MRARSTLPRAGANSFRALPPPPPPRVPRYARLFTRARAGRYVFHELRSPLNLIMLAVANIQASLGSAMATSHHARSTESATLSVRARARLALDVVILVGSSP